MASKVSPVIRYLVIYVVTRKVRRALTYYKLAIPPAS